MEREIQYVVRQVVADVLRTRDPELAQLLEKADNQAMDDLRRRIEKAKKAWSHEFKVIAVRNDAFLWRLFPTLIESPADGPLIKLEWGWGAGQEGAACPSVTTGGEDAFDLALKILSLFTEEGSEPKRPSRPEVVERPEVSRFFDDFMELAQELMERLGDPKGGCSVQEVNAWVQAGKPDEPKPHAYVDYPEDHVMVCSVCGHWYGTDADDWGTRVCSQSPLREFQTIHDFDPRRSAGLREAQRLDQLTTHMGKLEATAPEVEPLLLRLREGTDALSPEDRARFDKERVGIDGE